MDALLRKQGSLYAGARRALIDWATAREALCSLFSAVCNVLNRLRVVHVGALYTRLGVGDALPELATRKQLEALHGLLQSVHEEVRCFTSSCRQLRGHGTLRCSLLRSQKLCGNWSVLPLTALGCCRRARAHLVRARQRLARDCCRLQGVRPAQGGGARHGAAPSLADSVEVRCVAVATRASTVVFHTQLYHRGWRTCGACTVTSSRSRCWLAAAVGSVSLTLALRQRCLTPHARSPRAAGCAYKRHNIGHDRAGFTALPGAPFALHVRCWALIVMDAFAVQTLLNAEPNVQPLRRDALLSRVAV